MKRLTDPSFRYVPAVETDIRATFRRERTRIRKQVEEEKKKAEQHQAETAKKVTKLGLPK